MSHFSIGTRALTVMFIACGLAEARPLNVRDSSPAAEAIVDGRNAQYVVRFDGWVDHGASQMDITENGKVVCAASSRADLRAAHAHSGDDSFPERYAAGHRRTPRNPPQ